MDERRLLAVARGDEPADLLFFGGRVANVLTGELEEVEVAVAEGRVAGLGSGYRADETVDLEGGVLTPGLIDAHVHIESSLVTPPEFARAVVPRGTTTVVSDPHEIANVHGVRGIRYMLEASEGLPLDVRVMASSCVPATSMGTAGASLEADDLAALLDHPRVLGLAEVMNFPGAIYGDPGVLAKIAAFRGRPIDGHAPGVSGLALNAYVAAGPGSDHECTTAAEATEKLRRGLWVFLREATNARNLRALVPALTPATMRRVALCTDDRQPPDLLDEGGIDAMVRIAVEEGLTPIAALTLATLNPSEYFGLRDRGRIAPGCRADLVVVRDLADFRADSVYVRGRRVAVGGVAETWPAHLRAEPPAPVMRADPDAASLRLPTGPAEGARARVIVAIPDQIVTGRTLELPSREGDEVVADPGRDLLKIAVLERHLGTGNVGVGLVRGIGLERGAIAGSVAHDHHNLIAIGVDDVSMRSALAAVARAGGGMAVAEGAAVLATLPLPVAGLMSERPIADVRRDLDALLEAAAALGSTLHDPFMAMSFLGLEVIPSLKLTDQGLIDVDAFEPVDFWVEDSEPPGG